MLDYFDDRKDSPNKTVLIVDNDFELISFLASQCSSMGLTVSVANDASSAIDSLNYCIPDLLILDAGVPEENGISFLNFLEANPLGRKIPTIVLCKDTDLDSVPRAQTMTTYYAYKSESNWPRIESYINEQVDLKLNTAN